MLLGIGCSDDGTPSATGGSTNAASTSGGPEGTSVTLSTTTISGGESEGESEASSGGRESSETGSGDSGSSSGSDASSDTGSSSDTGDTSETSSSTGEEIVGPILNEFVFNDAATDDAEFVEVLGSPNTDYGTYALIAIEGDGTPQAGTIDDVSVVGVTDAAGYWQNGPLAGAYENGSITVLLVRDPVGVVQGEDLDANNDGTLDASPWAEIVDCVGVRDGDNADLVYCGVVLTQGYDGIAATVPGASRIPDGIDTDQASDWVRDTDDPNETPAQVLITEAVQTPGAENQLGTLAPPPPP